MPLNYRTLWLSDVHLGTAASRAADLLDFLGEVSADRIYLAGDIVDLQRMKVRPNFSDLHREVVSRLVRLAGCGTEVIYIPGNHDFEFRDLAGREICGIPVMLEARHQTACGRNLLVTHGDVLDARIRKGSNLEQFGAAAYRLLLDLDVMINQLRMKLGGEYAPVSARIKERIRSANEYIRRFEEVAAQYAAERGYDGIVCGHIHRPAVREIDGIFYANDGDWVEHRSALAESADGTLRVLHWHASSVLIEPGDLEQPLAA